MSSLKERTGEKIHKRSIVIDSFPVSEDELIYTGTLTDKRYKESVLFNGNVKPAGFIHHMIIRILVQFPDFLIKELEVEMPEYPRPQCIQTIDCLAPLKGSVIGPGFTMKVRKLAGGNRGCAHLVNLMITMAPAVVQGFWSYKTRKQDKHEKVSSFIPDEKMSGFLADTCYVWREDGETFQDLKEAIKNRDR